MAKDQRLFLLDTEAQGAFQIDEDMYDYLQSMDLTGQSVTNEEAILLDAMLPHASH